MRSRAVLLLLFASLVPVAFAQLENADPETQARCKRAMSVHLPSEAAEIAMPSKWPECNSYKLYSGLGTTVDIVAARRCAWKERLAQEAGIEPRFTVASVFGGSAMLSVLYANGQGVQRDQALAIRFACEAGGAPGEIGGRIQHLEKLEKPSSPTGNTFDFCDDITSGFMEGFCAARASELQDQRREDSIRSITDPFTADQKTAFGNLRRAEETYAESHGRGEIDLSGSARAMFQIDAEDSLRDDFIEAVTYFESGNIPGGDAASYREADSKLNIVYRRVMAKTEQHKSEYGAVQPEGIRAAERAWLKYRDAWLVFAKVRYPNVPPEAWLTLLTRDRISVLDGSFCDMDAEDGPCASHGDTWKPSPLP